jgi:hypothetical protein
VTYPALAGSATVERFFDYEWHGSAAKKGDVFAGQTFLTTYAYFNGSGGLRQETYSSGQIVTDAWAPGGVASRIFRTFLDDFSMSRANQLSAFTLLLIPIHKMLSPHLIKLLHLRHSVLREFHNGPEIRDGHELGRQHQLFDVVLDCRRPGRGPPVQVTSDRERPAGSI